LRIEIKERGERKQETGNKEQETRNKEQGTGWKLTRRSITCQLVDNDAPVNLPRVWN